MYVIFKNECVFYLTDREELRPNSLFLRWKDLNLKELMATCENTVKSVQIYHPDLSELWNAFKNEFKNVEAAGGVVFNSQKDILFILRDGVWDLPKGKIEKGESIKQAAVREVQEETAIGKIHCGDFIETTYHIYEYQDEQILKFSHWFKMFSDSRDFKPQTEEGITEVKWVPVTEIQPVLSRSYGNIRMLIRHVLNPKH